MYDLKEVINEKIYKECTDFIKRVRESTHTKILERQRNKFDRLSQPTRDQSSNCTGGPPKEQHPTQ